MKLNLKTKEICMIGLAAALMAVFSQVSIPLPFTTVPITLQVFGVALLSIILDRKCSTIALLIFTLVGLIGIPVYAGFQSGAGVLFGATGGYIFGFILMAFITGSFTKSDKKYMPFVGAYLGMIVEYVAGTIQLKIVLSMSLKAAIIAGIAPFIIKDIILVFVAVIVGETIRNRVTKAALC